ncbi:hypothetical protein FRC00_009496 [Tulasnella sp. 408]|nr:hypothetical protein FRC00_009496 [Tulasnella sp. 408]
MAQRSEPTSHSQATGTKRKRPKNNMGYLPWNVQEKIKRRRVEEMKMRSSYSKERKKALGTGANAGVVDSGWPRKTKALDEGEGANDTVSSLEGAQTTALDADRKPVQLPLPAPKPRKEPKRSIEPPRSSSARGASIPNVQGQEAPTKPEAKHDQVLGSDGRHNSNEAEGPSFRELKRAAYSRQSLHTYKSRSVKDKHGDSSMAYNPDRQHSNFSGATTLYGEGASEPKFTPNESFQTDYAAGYQDEPLARPRPQFAQQSRDSQRVSFAPPKSTGDLRLWRHDERGNMWTKGGRRRCVGRFCCCTVMMTLFLIVSIVLALALWARPPDIRFNGISLPTGGSAVQVQTDSLDINLSLSIGVKNPNFFGASFKSIDATAFYPPLTSQLGGGTLHDINFPANSDTQFLFPFNITYSSGLDPNNILVTDLVNKCGIKPGSTKSKLTVKYQLKSFGGEALLKSLGVE